MSTEQQIKKILSEAIPSLQVIYLFGSRASGVARPQSDYDCAFLASERVTETARYQLGQSIAAELNSDVDLIDLGQASTVLQVQIVETGKVIYCRDEVARGYFEMYVFSDYARLNEERHDIIEQFYNS